MESLTYDSELADEVVKLLGQELKVVRAQLREAQQHATPSAGEASLDLEGSYKQRARLAEAENSRLTEENARLKAEVVQLRSLHECEDFKPLIPQYEASMKELRRQLAESLEEKNRLSDIKGDERIQFEKKLSLIREKYKSLKETKQSYGEALEEIKLGLEEMEKQRDDSLIQLVKAQEEIASLTRTPRTDTFDLQIFLETHCPPTDANQPVFEELLPYSNKPKPLVSHLSKSLCGVLHRRAADFLLPSDTITHGIALEPLHRYNPMARAGTGAWEQAPKLLEVGERRDVLYYENNKWYYVGTFQCVASEHLADVKQVQQLSSRAMSSLVARTLYHSELVPPIVSKMIRSMYEGGALGRIQCFALQCVGFDGKLYRTLLDEGGNSKAVTPIPKGGSTKGAGKKRKRGGGKEHLEKKTKF